MKTYGLIWLCAALLALGCGDDDDDDGGNEADRVGIAAECAVDEDCDAEPDAGLRLSCLPQFKGGYCGSTPCSDHADCPAGGLCVNHEGTNYCFRACDDKAECNRNRSADNEANCSSSVDLVGETERKKACVPPSSGA